ncbi:MAG: FtsQ-type POTRA domain-containing protein [Bdellovibrionales bacterium]|nr:FtsQ-type POTRA domain-containing protein [Bdellovibrionales bacterium]
MKISTVAVILLNSAVLAFSVWAMTQAVQSPLFTLKVVEVSGTGEDSPVTADELIQVAAVPVDRINLFSLDLDPIEKRLLTHPWIRKVHLEKQFPQTLVIVPEFREVKAVIISMQGKVSYVDATGTVFGRVKSGSAGGFPVFSARIHQGGTDLIRRCLGLIEAFEQQVGQVARIESLEEEGPRGIQGWISYPLQSDRARAQVIFPSQDSLADLGKVRSVVKYLSERQISVSQIWADLGKKIVVKIARRF